MLDRADFILGQEVEEFEERFAELCGAARAVGVNSGTDALLLPCRRWASGREDEVIVPRKFVRRHGQRNRLESQAQRPVFVDVGPDYNMDPRGSSARSRGGPGRSSRCI